MNTLKKSITVLFLILISFNTKAQMSLTDIDFYRIPQKKVKKYINNQVKNHIELITDLIPSCPESRDISDFNEHIKTYDFDIMLDSVWNNYLAANPSVAWESRIVSFGCLVDKTQNEVMYRDQDQYSGIDTAQVIYLNLKILKGIYNLAVAFEVINIDEENRTIEFSYVEGGKALGKQQLIFEAIDENHTRLTHRSHFKSKSNFRDKFIYPFFHEKSINQFHQNMAEIIHDHQLLADSVMVNEK